jgi:hypothetical protein
MMPKGVEHQDIPQVRGVKLPIQIPMMPKGDFEP